jgi:hypothetical protein
MQIVEWLLEEDEDTPAPEPDDDEPSEDEPDDDDPSVYPLW